MRTFAFAAVTLATGTAAAEESQRFRVDASVGYVMLGGKPQTGGAAPSLSGRALLRVNERVTAGAGGGVTAFGFMGGARWVAVLGGPVFSIGARLSSVVVECEASFDFGRVPVCNAWGLCLRYWGMFPRLGAHAGYQVHERFAVGGSVSVRVVNTLGWSGVSFEPAITGRFGF